MLETYPDQVIEEMPNRFQHAALLLFMLAAINPDDLVDDHGAEGEDS